MLSQSIHVHARPRPAPRAAVSIPPAIADALAGDRVRPDMHRWADSVAAEIDMRPHGIALRIGEHTSSASVARAMAHRLAHMLRDALVRRGAPPVMEIEFDAEQAAEVSDALQHRTLLPHHDGGNASFLTPSVLDDPRFGAHQRRTQPKSVTTTRRHKMYQGFLLRAVGECESVTTYYDLLAMVRAAYRYQTHGDAASTAELARWTGANLRRALAIIEEHRGTYLTLGGLLGSRDSLHCVIPVHRAEAGFTTEQTTRFPALHMVSEAAPAEYSPSEWLFDRMLTDVIGDGWSTCRERFELGVEGLTCDFILGHNLTLLHGGWRGGRGRMIEPICFTLEHASGDAYERWLWDAWRRPHRDAADGSA